MNHLLTFAQFVARRFAKCHKKLIIVRESKHMKTCLGNCGYYRYDNNSPPRLKGRVVYIIGLNIRVLEKYDPDEALDVIKHELAHTIVYKHGPGFRRVCAHLGIDKRHWGKNAK